MIADLFARLAPNPIVEWVPKEDPMVASCWPPREDVFADYTARRLPRGVRRAASSLVEEAEIPGTVRRLFRFRRLDSPVAG